MESPLHGGDYQGIKMTDALWDALAERGLSTSRNKMKDAESIVGHEHANELEAAELRLQGFEARSGGGLDPAALVLRGTLGTDSPGWFFNSSGGYKKTANGRRADVEFLRDGFVSLILLEVNGRRWVSSDRSIGLLLMNQAVELADQWLELGPGGAFIPLEDQNVILRTRVIDAGGDGAMVKQFISGQGSPGGNTMINFPIPQAEYGNTQSAHDVTPNLRAMLRANERLAPSAPLSAPLVQRSTPVATGGLVMDQVRQAVQLAIASIAADLARLKASGSVVTRATHRRAIAPQIGRGGAPVVTRSVATSIHGGLPSSRRVFSPRQVARRSYGLSLTERSVETRPAAYQSRYQLGSTFATPADRDRFDAGLGNQPSGVPVHGDLVKRNLEQFPTI